MEQQPTLLFVGGLPLHACDQNLSKYFRKFGPLDSAEVKRTPDGKSKGYGFVKFIRAEDARSAMQTQNHIILGRAINLEIAKDPQENQFLAKARTNRKLMVSGIPGTTDLQEILASLSKVGAVEKLSHMKNAGSDGTFGCTAIMQDYQKAQDLIKLSYLVLKNGAFLHIAGVPDVNLGGDRVPLAARGRSSYTPLRQDYLVEHGAGLIHEGHNGSANNSGSKFRNDYPRRSVSEGFEHEHRQLSPMILLPAKTLDREDFIAVRPRLKIRRFAGSGTLRAGSSEAAKSAPQSPHYRFNLMAGTSKPHFK